MEKIKIELRKISKTVAKIEVEHGEKLQILFDAFKVHDQKIDRIEQKLDLLEKQLSDLGKVNFSKHNDVSISSDNDILTLKRISLYS